MFRIGHLGDFNDLTLMGALSGVEMGLALAGVPHRSGGVAAAMDVRKGDTGGKVDRFAPPPNRAGRLRRIPEELSIRKAGAAAPGGNAVAYFMLTIPRRVTTPGLVLFLLCVMYFITYIDRVNVGTAAPIIGAELGLSNTSLGLIFSGFAYPYALFQIIGGVRGGQMGAAPDAADLRPNLGRRDSDDRPG